MRITPAGAGKTKKEPRTQCYRSDHPRGCGENGAHARRWCCEMGSPPRMRGKQKQKWKKETHTGITPADAGKTRRQSVSLSLPLDHPRGCGENHEGKVVSAVHQGSPPRMRGKPVTKQLWHRRVGITPADAGKTRHAMLAANRRWDHPRGCGENGAIKDSGNRTKGSPPRMRGKRAIDEFRKAFPGITPADAGKTGLFTCSKMRTEDHPRGCGENSFSPYSQIGQIGSPPRMRGKPIKYSNIIISCRITPADAGKTYTPRE